MKQALARGEKEEAKMIALENKFFVPTVTSLMVVQPCERDHAGQLEDPEEGAGPEQPDETEEGVEEQDNPPRIEVQNSKSIEIQNNTKNNYNNNWYREKLPKTKPNDGQDYSVTKGSKNQHWDYDEEYQMKRNKNPCKLVLFSRKLGKGQKKVFFTSKKFLGAYKNWAWSGRYYSQCFGQIATHNLNLAKTWPAVSGLRGLAVGGSLTMSASMAITSNSFPERCTGLIL